MKSKQSEKELQKSEPMNEKQWKEWEEDYRKEKQRIIDRKMSYKEQRKHFLHKFVKVYEEDENKLKYPVIYYVADILEGGENEVWRKVCYMFPGVVIRFRKIPWTLAILFPILNMKSWEKKGKYNFTSGCNDLHKENINNIISKKHVIEELKTQPNYETLIKELENDKWEQEIIADVAQMEDMYEKGRYHYEVIEYVAEELCMIPKQQYIMGKGYINDYSKVHKYDDIINKALANKMSITECAKLVKNRISVNEMPDNYG